MKEIISARKTKDIARLEMHNSNVKSTFDSLKNNVISIQISNNKNLEHIDEDELELVLKGAENTLSTIAHQNAALKGAIGITNYIPSRT